MIQQQVIGNHYNSLRKYAEGTLSLIESINITCRYTTLLGSVQFLYDRLIPQVTILLYYIGNTKLALFRLNVWCHAARAALLIRGVRPHTLVANPDFYREIYFDHTPELGFEDLHPQFTGAPLCHAAVNSGFPGYGVVGNRPVFHPLVHSICSVEEQHPFTKLLRGVEPNAQSDYVRHTVRWMRRYVPAPIFIIPDLDF